MWSYSFTVFLSAFQLLPTAPFHILSLGGSHLEAGLFLGFLTYASAISAPITGAIGDRFGKRRVLIVASLAITVFSLLYAIAPSYQMILGAGAGARRVLVGAAVELELVHARHRAAVASRRRHGLFGIRQHPRRRRGAVDRIVDLRSRRLAAAVFRGGGAQRHHGGDRVAAAARSRMHAEPRSMHPRDLIEWRILIGAVTLFLYSFSYGGITSFVAVYAEQLGVPRALYFTVVLPDDRRRRGRSSAATPIASATRTSSCRAWR